MGNYLIPVANPKVAPVKLNFYRGKDHAKNENRKSGGVRIEYQSTGVEKMEKKINDGQEVVLPADHFANTGASTDRPARSSILISHQLNRLGARQAMTPPHQQKHIARYEQARTA